MNQTRYRPEPGRVARIAGEERRMPDNIKEAARRCYQHPGPGPERVDVRRARQPIVTEAAFLASKSLLRRPTERS